MTTKERIVDEALSLFAIHGYKGTSVKNIAEAVGIKDSSLYKHFKSKQEILDTIVRTMDRRIGDMSEAFGLPADTNMEQAVSVYAAYDEDEIVEFSKRIFLFYLKDSYISRFWRMGHIEQFSNPAVYQVYAQLFLEDSITYQIALFAELIREKVFIEANPRVMAMNFYTPIFFLLSKYANKTADENEALETLELQVREFCRIYKA